MIFSNRPVFTKRQAVPGIAITLMVLATSSLAQEQAASPETAAELSTIPVEPLPDSTVDPMRPAPLTKNRIFEEVIVTAQKREEKLQDVPISIQAFSGESMAARGIETTAQLGTVVPSLQFTYISSYTLIFMRGIGTDNFVPSADPSIATYVDGIYVPGGQSVSQSLGGVQRVEVLKGPQGTLFGRNSTGGAISITTEEPGNEFKSSFEGSLGNLDSSSIKGSVNIPLTDSLAISVAGLSSRQNNPYTNPNYQLQDDATRAARFKLRLLPSENTSLNLTAYIAEQQGLGSLIGKNTNPSLLGQALAIQPQRDDYDSVSDFFARSESNQRSVYGNFTWNLPQFDMKLLGSDQMIVTDYAGVDFDSSPIPLAAFDVTNQYTDIQTAELQIVSNDSSWAADKLQWVTGLYYLKSSAGLDPGRLKAAPSAVDALLQLSRSDTAGALGQQLQDFFTSIGLENTPLGSGGLTVNFRGLLGTKSYSAFAQGTFSLSDYWDVTLGGRYQREKRFLEKAKTQVANFDGDGDTTLFDFDLQSAIATNFSPKAVLSYHPRVNALIYASYSVGFKSGTYNIVNIYLPPNYIKPEEVTTYELGVKVDFLDGLLRVNAAVFDNEIENLQSGFVSLLSGGSVRFLTAKKARTQGAEADITWLPMPDSNPGLALAGNAAYVDAKFKDFQNCAGFEEGSGLYNGALDCSGNRMVRTPEWSGGVGAVQSLDVGSGTLEIAVDEYFNSGFYYNANNTVKEKAYRLLNARVSYLYTPWNIRLTAFGSNLTNRRYHIQQFETDFGTINTLASTREYGLRLNWDW